MEAPETIVSSWFSNGKETRIVYKRQHEIAETEKAAAVPYDYDEFLKRIEILKTTKFSLSNQYGMLFLVDEEGHIILNVSGLVALSQRMKRG